MNKNLLTLRTDLQTISALQTASSILSWDESTYMPPEELVPEENILLPFSVWLMKPLLVIG